MLLNRSSDAIFNRSIHGEVIACLDRSLRSRKIERKIFIQETRQLRKKLKVPPLTEEFLTNAKNQDRV